MASADVLPYDYEEYGKRLPLISMQRRNEPRTNSQTARSTSPPAGSGKAFSEAGQDLPAEESAA